MYTIEKETAEYTSTHTNTHAHALFPWWGWEWKAPTQPIMCYACRRFSALQNVSLHKKNAQKMRRTKKSGFSVLLNLPDRIATLSSLCYRRVCRSQDFGQRNEPMHETASASQIYRLFIICYCIMYLPFAYFIERCNSDDLSNTKNVRYICSIRWWFFCCFCRLFISMPNRMWQFEKCSSTENYFASTYTIIKIIYNFIVGKRRSFVAQMCECS